MSGPDISQFAAKTISLSDLDADQGRIKPPNGRYAILDTHICPHDYGRQSLQHLAWVLS